MDSKLYKRLIKRASESVLPRKYRPFEVGLSIINHNSSMPLGTIDGSSMGYAWTPCELVGRVSLPVLMTVGN